MDQGDRVMREEPHSAYHLIHPSPCAFSKATPVLGKEKLLTNSSNALYKTSSIASPGYEAPPEPLNDQEYPM